MIISDKRNLSLPEDFPEGEFLEREFPERDYKNKSDACMNLQASLFVLLFYILFISLGQRNFVFMR